MMEFSEEYHKRKEYLRSLALPTIAEASCHLGDQLTEVLIDDCPDELQKEIDVSKKLRGPGNTLWVSPSDMLIGRVVLTPPLTQRHIKALTHEGILCLGEQIEAQWLASLEMEKRQIMDYLEELMMMLAERDKERCIAEALADRDKAYQERMAKLQLEFDELLKSELQRLEETLRDYYEQLIEERVNDVLAKQGEFVEDKIQEAIDATVQELTEKFLQQLSQQEQELTGIFEARLEGQRDRFQEEVRMRENVFVVVMKQLKHSLQCNNISCLMYVLCIERRKCLQAQQYLIDSNAERIHKLEADVAGRAEEICKLKTKFAESEKRVIVREECLRGVLCQFQKFINFALNAVPSQAEFLLNVEKMMTFELTQTLARIRKHTHLAKLLMPWKTVSQDSVLHAKKKSSINFQNYHDCLNELSPPPCPEDDATGELYAMTYRDRLYVREDFRNKISQKLAPRRSAELWSKEVRDLVRLIENAQMNDEEQSSPKEMPGSPNTNRSFSAASSVRFVPTDMPDQPPSAGLLGVNDSIIMHRSKYSLLMNGPEDDLEERIINQYHHSDDIQRSSIGIALLGTTDSVTLLKEKVEKNSEDNADMMGSPRGVHRLTEQQRSKINSTDLEVVAAPSTETIHLNKPVSSKTPDAQQVISEHDEVTLRLNKHLKSQDNTVTPLPKVSVAKKPEKESTKQIKERNSRMRTACESTLGRISMHRDSLELIPMRESAAKNRLKSLLTPVDAQSAEYPIKQFVVNTPSEMIRHRVTEVNFEKIAQVFTELHRPERPWKIYETTNKAKSQSPGFKTTPRSSQSSVIEKSCTNYLKQERVANIVGIGASKQEVNATSKDFTIHRMHSILDVLKKDESLIRMFTKCGQ